MHLVLDCHVAGHPDGTQETRKNPLQRYQGLKYFDQLAPLLERLHEVGTERDKAGNRKLFMDQYCMMVLLYLFDPVVDSLRGL